MKTSSLQRLLLGIRKATPGRGRPLRLREVVLVTTPVVLVLIFFAAGAVRDYLALHQFDDFWSRSASVDNQFVRRVQVAINGPRAARVAQKLDADATDAGIVRLEIPKDQWAALQRDKLTTWGVWVDAGLMRGDLPEPVRIRRRGDTSVHWTTEKMSFTLRTPGSQPFRGYRTLAFSVADVLPQTVALALTQDFGLLAPSTTVAPVFVNRRYYGIYQVTETVDDDFLARHGQVPGVIFQGDAAERGDVFRGVPRGLFMNPYTWEFAAGDEDNAPADRAPLMRFIKNLNETTFDTHLRLMAQLDRAEIARLVALLLITGDPYHMDNVHNQFWYADPVSSLMRPIPWDVRLLDLSEPPIWVNKFLRAALRDPFVVDEALRYAHGRIQDGVIARAEQMARSTYERYRAHFLYDELRAGVISDVGKPDEVTRVLNKNAKLLGEWAGNAEAVYRASVDGEQVVLDLESRGYAGSDLTGLVVPNAGAGLPSVRLIADYNRNGRPDAEDRVIPGSWESGNGNVRFVLSKPEALLAGWDTRGKGIVPGAVHYRFFLTGAGNRLVGVIPELRNRVTGQAAQVTAWTGSVTATPTLSWSPWQFPAVHGSLTRWSGTVEVRDTVRLAAVDTLIIEPGTTIRLHPEASIISRGVVLARGTAAAPITFSGTVADRPWGVLALQGTGANGSTITHAHFTGGGGAAIDGIRYRGIVNVYRASNVSFEDVEISRNLRSDAAFDATFSTVTLRRCVVTRTNADGVRFEQSGGEIRECRFEDAGDDAIVLIGSSPRVIGNQVLRAARHGIAIRDNSQPFVFNNQVMNSNVGIDVRGARALLADNVVSQNSIGLQQQDARGRSGWVTLLNTAIAGNVSDVEANSTARTTELDAANPSSLDVQRAVRLMYGVRAVSTRAGLPDSWSELNPVAPRDAQAFEEDFASVSDGWLPLGGALRLDKRDVSLIATLDKRRGGMQRPVDWNVTGDTAVLLLEMAGRDVGDVAVVVNTAGRTIRERAVLSSTPGAYRYVAVKLPPGHYRSIALEAMPRRTGWEIDPATGFMELRKSRLELAGFQLLQAHGRVIEGRRSVALTPASRRR